ncbi:hypothetical protein GCM10026983_19640 [Gracilibacillus alcaliphilus]
MAVIKDHLLVNSEGESYISYADYAIAVLDEIENPKHINEKFTVVGESNFRCFRRNI